jgi:hypothetical protein
MKLIRTETNKIVVLIIALTAKNLQMNNEWNPENIVNKVLNKQQFYIINSVLVNKVLDVDELNGKVLYLSKR